MTISTTALPSSAAPQAPSTSSVRPPRARTQAPAEEPQGDAPRALHQATGGKAGKRNTAQDRAEPGDFAQALAQQLQEQAAAQPAQPAAAAGAARTPAPHADPAASLLPGSAGAAHSPGLSPHALAQAPVADATEATGPADAPAGAARVATPLTADPGHASRPASPAETWASPGLPPRPGHADDDPASAGPPLVSTTSAAQARTDRRASGAEAWMRQAVRELQAGQRPEPPRAAAPMRPEPLPEHTPAHLLERPVDSIATASAEALSPPAPPAGSDTAAATPIGFAASPPGPGAPAAQAAMASHTTQLPQAPGSAAWQQALGQQLVFMSQAGLDQAELQLNPLELGPLTVRLSLEQGQLSARFSADQATVREAVQAALPTLRTALAEQGLNLGEAAVASGGAGARDDSPRPGNGRPDAPHRSAPAAAVGARLALIPLPPAPAPGPGRLHTWA